MAEKYYSTLEVAKMLDVHPSRLSRAVWIGKIEQPAKSPGKGVFLWTKADIGRASLALRKCDASDIFDHSLSGFEKLASETDRRFMVAPA